jgi:hypothetical protein
VSRQSRKGLAVSFCRGTSPALARPGRLNDHRRHLNPSQLAMVGAKWAQLKVGNPNLIPPIGGIAQTETKTRDEASKLLGVGTSSIDRAKQIIKHGTPELVAAVETGEGHRPSTGTWRDRVGWVTFAGEIRVTKR